jgi:hypothetical protein
MSTNLGGSIDYVFTLELLVDIEAMKYFNWMKNICGLKQQKFGEVWMPKKRVLIFTTQKKTNLEDVLEEDDWMKEVFFNSKFLDMVVCLKILAHTAKKREDHTFTNGNHHYNSFLNFNIWKVWWEWLGWLSLRKQGDHKVIVQLKGRRKSLHPFVLVNYHLVDV